MQQRKAADPYNRSAAFDALFARLSAKNYSAVIAPVGQAPSQAPQSMQASAFAILNSNCTNGASALASAAANTCVRNLVCHNRTLLYLPVLSIYEETCLCTALADPSEIVSLTAF